MVFPGSFQDRCGFTSRVGFEVGFRPDGELLFFAPPKKSIQKKGGPEGLPADAGSLRFSPVWALAELAGFAAPAACKSSSNRAARSIPNRLRCSAAPTGFRDGAPGPVALAEYRRQTGQKERALFEASHDGIEDPVMAPSCARRPVWRGTQGIGASRRGHRVPFSLGNFSWASKRKYLAVRAKPDFKFHSG